MAKITKEHIGLGLIFVSVMLLMGIAGSIEHAAVFDWRWLPAGLLAIVGLFTGVVMSNESDGED